MEKNSKGSGFFAGLIFGGIIGVIIGFILSQKSGKFKDLVAQGREAIREAIEEGKEAAARREAELRGDLEKEEK